LLVRGLREGTGLLAAGDRGLEMSTILPEFAPLVARGPSLDPLGFDAGKLIKGKKRHILVDTKVCCCTRSFIPLVFRIAMVASGCSPRCSASPSAEDRLPKSLHFAESDVIIGVVGARSVHKIGYGHNCDWAA
jgi:hypothetical protein